jgi:hypothetical protein
MSKVIIYPWKGHLAVSWPSPVSKKTVKEIAESGTPAGIPFRIVDATDLPSDWTFFDAWTADFTNPDGYGKQEPKGNVK